MPRVKPKTEKTEKTEKVEEIEAAPEPMRSAVTGALLDPVDGRPVFADGLSRRRWLEVHHDELKAAAFGDFVAPTDDDSGDQ